MRDAAGRGKESRGKVASSGLLRSFQRLSLMLSAASVGGASGMPCLLIGRKTPVPRAKNALEKQTENAYKLALLAWSAFV